MGAIQSRVEWSKLLIPGMKVAARLALVLVLAVSGCASVAPLDIAVHQPTPPPALRFGVDTFAFPNESRTKNAGKPDLYANYCFVMARGVTQFHKFAHFDPTVPTDARVVIPGYASLYEFSREQEVAVKAGLGTQFWTMVHWTNWRVVFPMPRWQQERVAREALAELQAGRLVQFLVTNLPSWELNHTVLAYAYR